MWLARNRYQHVTVPMSTQAGTRWVVRYRKIHYTHY
jgi:hypothetical protein